MLHCFDFVREMDLLSVTVRLALAMLCGGLIGIEREYKRRPAGFRTHILICLGAAMTTLTSQYLYLVLGLYTDIARLGAQVIAGIGFIGAGTIVVTKRQHVKGLTTAAGLWVAAIIGLMCGAGYAEAALFATLAVLFAEILLVRLEYRFARTATDANLYIEYTDANAIEKAIFTVKSMKAKLTGLEISRIANGDSHCYCAMVSVRMDKKHPIGELTESLTRQEGITLVEEL